MVMPTKAVMGMQSNDDLSWYMLNHDQPYFVKKYFFWSRLFQSKCDALRDLAPLVQFEKREKHPWRSVTFSKVAG